MAPSSGDAFETWGESVERAFFTIRRFAFAVGALATSGLAYTSEWLGGWVVAGLLAAHWVRTIVTPRGGTTVITREVFWDAFFIGVVAWSIDVRGVAFILIYPLAIALLLGNVRLAWQIGALSLAVNSLVYAGTTFPESEFAKGVSGFFGAPAWDVQQAEFLTYMAVYVVGALLLIYLWQMSTRLRAAERTQKMLLRGAAHDINNAIAAISGLADLLGEHDDEALEEIIAALTDTAAETTSISGDLASLARHAEDDDSQGAQAFDLAQLVRHASVGKPIVVEGPETLMYAGYPQRTGQIIRNLVSNALRHGGPTVVASVVDTGDAIEVRIADNGPGITGPVFEVQPSSHADGMGIGLVLSKRLAERLGGDLEYRRSAGWTVFALTLPRTDVTGDG